MKKLAQNSTRLFTLTCLIIFLSMVYSCQTEEIMTPTNTTKKSSETLKTAAATIVSNLVSSGNCSTDCIKADGPYFITTDQQIVTWGGGSKTVNIEYYNTATDFVLKVKSTNGWSDLIIDGISKWTNGPVAANTWGTYTIPLSAGWNACDLKSFALNIAGNGPQAKFAVSYNLFGICPEGCLTTFTGEAIYCGTSREAVYTFTPKEDVGYFKIQGGLTNFTGADAVVTVTGGDNIVITQTTPGGSSNRIIKVEGAASKCSEVKINIKWNSTNTGGVITGSWSVSTDNVNVAPDPVAGLICN